MEEIGLVKPSRPVKVIEKIKDNLANLLTLVFPHHCPGCGGTLLRQEGEVCLDCMTEIPQTGFHHHLEDNELYYRIAGKVDLAGAGAMYYFDKHGRMKRIVQTLKYKGRPRLGNYLGEEWGAVPGMQAALAGIDLLVPVPLHKTRQRKRGYNQAAQIAFGLGKSTGIKVDTKSLVRIRATETQTRKGREERWENVKDVFELRNPLTGHVGLVDDVITTGATLEASIRALRAGSPGHLKVTVLPLCMARM